MCESLVSTGNLSAGETQVEETDITNDLTAHVHPMLPGDSVNTTVGFSNQKKCDQEVEDILNPHQQVHSSCSHCIGGGCYHALLDQNTQSHSQHQYHSEGENNMYPLDQIHSSCSNCTDSDRDSCHSLLNQNYQSHMVVLCDRETNHSSKIRGCFSSTILKSPYLACVALLCIVTLVIVGISLRNNNTSDTSLNTVVTPSISSSKSLLTQIDFINKANNVSTSSPSSPKQEDMISDTQSTTAGQDYSTATTLNVLSVNDILKNAVTNLRKQLPCEPQIVKLGLKNAINQPTNSILDLNLYPQVVAVKRCNHVNSYCGDEFGDLGQNPQKCVSVKNRTITVDAWDRVEHDKFIPIPIGHIHIIEDIQCQCK